jgi:hypothetical protein
MPRNEPLDRNAWEIERRLDGAVLVRVHSTERGGQRLPDAVFTFRRGDPQYDYWAGKLSDVQPARG